MLETAFRAVHHQCEGWADNFLPNVWIGATVSNQTEADRDIPVLLAVPAAKRFLSMEPLLGPVSLRWLSAWPENAPLTATNPTGNTNHLDGLRRLDGVIVGGESGLKARPMHPDWVRSLRDQCQSAGVPFFYGGLRDSGPRDPTGLIIMANAPTPRPPADVKAALLAARARLQADRSSLAESSTANDGSILPEDAAFVGEYDRILTQVDAALDSPALRHEADLVVANAELLEVLLKLTAKGPGKPPSGDAYASAVSVISKVKTWS